MAGRAVVLSMAGLMALTMAVTAQVGERPEIQLQAAIKRDLVDGDFVGAMEQYKALARSDNPVVAASALARLEAGYVKQGHADARARAQRDAAAGRQLASQGEPGSRRLWTGLGHSVSSDGRLISHVDDGVVFVHDVVTRTDQRLTEPADQLRPGHYAELSAISRDGRQVAYSWSIGPRYQLRVVDRAAKPGQAPRVLIDNPEITFVYPLDWSPDGQTMVVRIGRTNRHAEIAVVSARDGGIAVLKSIDWRGPVNAAFSPDGKYIAYDVIVEEKTRQRDVFVLTTDGARESRVVDHPSNEVVAGWSPDGGLLLFVSSRSGAAAVWGQVITDGRAVGEPRLLRSDLGALQGVVGTTNTGALLFVQRTSSVQVHTATVDFTTGRIVTRGAPVLETYLRGQRNPAWARDGKRLAWSTSPLTPGQEGVFAMVLSSDSERPSEVVGELSTGVLKSLGPDGSLTYQGGDLKGRFGIFRVDPRDGDTTPLALANDGFLSLPSWSEDGRFLVYRHQIPKSPGMMLRDMTSGTTRNLLPGQPFGHLAIAPDGRHVAFTEGGTAPRSVRLVNVGTGDTRELLKLPDNEMVSVFQWLPDSQRIVVWKSVNGKTAGTVISLQGHPPVALDATIPENAQIHPDGRRIAYETGAVTLEVWALEHFLPAAPRAAR